MAPDGHELDAVAQHPLGRAQGKGPNIGSFDPETGILVPLFNPRTQDRVTVNLLRLNNDDRIVEQQRLIAAGLL